MLTEPSIYDGFVTKLMQCFKLNLCIHRAHKSMSVIKNLLSDQEFINKVPFSSEKYNAHDEIVKESDEGRDVYLISSGQVRVCTSLGDEAEKLSPGLASLGEGDIFGELSLFDGEPRSAQIYALKDSEIVKIDGVALLKFMDKYPDKGYLIIREFFEHLVKHMRQNNIFSKNVLQLYTVASR